MRAMWQVVAFASKHPRALQHWLVVPRQHIPTIAHVTRHELPLLIHMQRVGASLLSHGAQRDGAHGVRPRSTARCSLGYFLQVHVRGPHVHMRT